jgi:receptor protein-tyrosine kinase
MTRLTEALERANLVPATSEGTPPAVKTSDEVLRTWHFDTTDNEPAPEAVAPRRRKQPTPAVVQGRFAEGVLDKIVVGEQADAGLVEQYRRVGAVLHHAQLQRHVRSVMVASAVAAEGKTLTATNLALTLSHSFDRRVLLIDADLRRPNVHEMFGLPNEHGLIESLQYANGGRLPVCNVSNNLWVLTAGRPTSDPMSSLVSEAMKQLLADAAEQFDWVIIDTPPVALMPDANLLAGMIDAALLVISASTTPYPFVQRAAAAIGPERILGVVLNRADRTAIAHEYGNYGYYDRAPRDEPPPSRKGFGLFSKARP